MKRVITAAIALPLALSCMFLNNYARLVLFFAAAIISVWEMKHIQKNLDQTCYVWPIYIGILAIGVCLGIPVTREQISFISIVIVMIMIFAVIFWGILQKSFDGKKSLNSLFVIAYPVIPFMIMMTATQKSNWLELIPMSFFSVWVCDSFALGFGKWLGKRKLAPQVSPNKTWAGAIGGSLSAAVFGIGEYYLFTWLSGISFLGSTFSYSIWECIIISFVLSIVGQIGDLAASLVKRTYGVKDYSNIIPGHGGIMDKCDSALFAVPCAMLCSYVVSLF